MNDNFKLIIIIGNNPLSKEAKTDETQNSFLQETVQYNIFTSYTPSNIIVATKKSVAGKYINEALFSKDDIYQFFLSNDSICFEFDEVFSQIHPIGLIFNMNFPIEEITNKLNSCILFSSQTESDKTPVYESFISKFITDYFEYFLNPLYSNDNHSMSISAYLIDQRNQFNLFCDKIASLEQANQMLNSISDKKQKYLLDNQIKLDNITISLSIQVKCSEINFIKLNIKQPLPSNNTLSYLSNDISTFVNLEKYEKVYLISCVSPSNDNFKKSIQELYFMNDIYKEINSVKGNNSLHIPLLDSLRSLTSIEDITSINNNNTMQGTNGTNRRYLSNAFSVQSTGNDNPNINSTNNVNANNQKEIIKQERENNISIIPPDCTMSLSETNYQIKNTKNDVESLYSYLKSLSLTFNDKNKYETKIKLLEEELNNVRKNKGEIEIDYKVTLEKANELGKTVIMKNEIIHELEEKNKKNKSEKKELEEMNRKNELKIMELMKENELLKAINDNYSNKYKTLREDHRGLNKRISTIQNTLSIILKNKDNTNNEVKANEL